MEKLRCFIRGEFTNPVSGEWFESFNPYEGKPWAMVPRGNTDDARIAVDAAYEAFENGPWRHKTAAQRADYLYRLADLIEEHAEELARIEVRDNGKLFAEMHTQVKSLPRWYRYYAELADKVEGRVLPESKPDLFTYTRHEPLGVVAAIVAWNSPLLLVAWKMAPALAAGNTIVIKPSEFASASTLQLMKLVQQVEFPPGVVNAITGYGHEVGQALVEDSRVAKIAFTGGELGGQKVYEAAAKSFKAVTLELGGKSPNIVFEDAKLENAVKGVISGIFAATGQTCIAGSRALVHESIHDEFVERLVALAKTAQIGDPQDSETQVGPITTKPQYEKVLQYIKIAKEEGAHCVLGGEKATAVNGSEGWFVQPTIFTRVAPTMRIAQEEVFGPVLTVIPFRSDEEAFAIANGVPYGLAAGVWTEDMSRALKAAEVLLAGTVWINTYRAFSPYAPFGGYKQSGVGRESGQEGLYAYLQTKTVWISTAKEVANPFVMRL